MIEPFTPLSARRKTRIHPLALGLLVLSVFLVGMTWLMVFLHSAPTSLPFRDFVIEPGMSVRDIANKAEREGFVRSSMTLYTILIYRYEPTELYAGTYRLTEPVNASDFAQKLAQNDIVIETLPLTVPEGVRASDIANLAAAAIPGFDATAFITLALQHEGYLFPETYHVPDHFSPAELVDLMLTTYTNRTAPIKEALASSTLSEYEVLTLASIIEREAKDVESMRTVSGILQNRLRAGMPLQADASIEYELGKPLAQLEPEDLERDSPYNTYRYVGLPPTPIGNPGLQAINAVLEPIESDYFFYITDQAGVFHYARTFEDHRANIEAYLQ